MNEYKIENLQELIYQYVGHDKIITDIQLLPLTAPGENYFSTMLAATLILNDRKTGTEDTFQAVAKCMLRTDEELPKHTTFTFKNEIAFYKEIVPVLEHFLKKEGVRGIKDILPEVYAVRSNLNGHDDDIDKHAVILLENLKTAGYSNTDRTIGFDLQGIKVVLRDLAFFHSSFVALEQKKSDVFQEKVISNIRSPGHPGGPPRPNGPPPNFPPSHGLSPNGASANGLPPNFSLPQGFQIPHVGPPDVFPPHAPPPGWTPPQGFPPGSSNGPPPGRPGPMRILISIIEQHDHLKPHIEKIKNLKPMFFGPQDNSKKPFKTLIHNDMWINNTMQITKNGTIQKNKFCDFQMFSYDSVARDVVFLILSSVQADFSRKHFDYLIKLYHEAFINNLKLLNCDINPFSFEDFMVEINTVGKSRLPDLLIMSTVIFGKKGVATVDISKGPRPDMLKEENITELAKERIIKLLEFYIARGWL